MSKLSPILVHAVAELETKVEAKVKAASTASAATAFILTLLGGLTVFHGGAIPAVITAAVGAAVTGALTFAAGWLAKHTQRTVAPSFAVPGVAAPAAPLPAAAVVAPVAPPAPPSL